MAEGKDVREELGGEREQSVESKVGERLGQELVEEVDEKFRRELRDATFRLGMAFARLCDAIEASREAMLEFAKEFEEWEKKRGSLDD